MRKLEFSLFQAVDSSILMIIKPSFHKANYDHDNDRFLVKTKRLVWRMTAQLHNRFVFVSWPWRLLCNGSQALV